MLKVLFSALALFVLVLLGLGSSYRVFLRRAVTYPFARPITQVDWYQPLEKVPGGTGVRQFSISNGPALSPVTLQKMVAYAGQGKSSALVVLHRGRLVLEHTYHGMLPFGRTNSMSMAKTVLGLLTGIAIDEKKINSEADFVWQYLPEWKDDPKRQNIRLRHLMQMTSGLVFNDNANSLLSDISWMHATDDLVPFILKTPGDGHAGDTFKYNNINAEIMGLVLERATGVRYAQYLSEKLWRPLGAASADLWLDRVGGMAKTYCCILAQPRDWALVGQLLLEGGRIGEKQVVAKSWIAKMTQPSERDLEYGYFTSLGTAGGKRHEKDRSEPFAAPDLFYLDGKAKQRVYVMPSAELVIVRVGENPAQWDDSYLPNLAFRELKQGAAGERH